MNPRAFRALLRLEFRRSLTLLGRQLVGVVVVVGVVAAFGWMNRSRLGFLVAVASAMLIMQGPAWVLRDKTDGALEFLRALPIPSVTLAASRLTFALLAGIPGGLGVAWGMLAWGKWPDGSPSLVPGGALGAVLAFVLGSALASVLATASALRFEANHLGNAFAVLILAAIALDELTPRLFPELPSLVRRLIEQPWAPQAIAAAGLLGTVLLALLAFHLARTGIERFRPGRDRITW